MNKIEILKENVSPMLKKKLLGIFLPLVAKWGLATT